MNPEQWERVKQLYAAAQERRPEERSSFLAACCGDDPGLLAEVKRLLSEDARPGDFLDAGLRVTLQRAATSLPSLEDFQGTKRFVLQRRLGAGGFGTVFEAYDRDQNTTVALKALHRTDATALSRFKGEFRSLADLSHPNLAALYELMSDGRHWFFTMELVDGIDFLSYVWRKDSLRAAAQGSSSAVQTVSSPGLDVQGHAGVTDHETPPVVDEARLRRALTQLADGVCALHEAGKVHRDIKPSNVLVTRTGRVVVLDFGLVEEMEAERPGQTQHIAGTPAYMSPEQATGSAGSATADWYSVGVMLFQALTGRLPFRGSYLEILEAKQRLEAPTPSVVAGFPEDLNALCVDLLRRDPAARPGGREVLRRLGAERPQPREATAAAPFVGRERELAVLREAFGAARQGSARTVYIHGSSGIGKSALVRRFLKEFEQRDQVLVLAGRCYERESVPYKALDNLVDALVRYLKNQPPAKAEAILPRDVLTLARLFPVLHQVEGVAGVPRRMPAIPDRQELRRRAFAAFRELLARLTDRVPLVLFIDDLQWGDLDSAMLLADLLRPPDPPPLLLIGCYRTEEATTSPLLRQLLEPREPDAAFAASATQLALAELSPLEARELAAALLALPEAARAEAVARESGGNPFFLQELVRASARETSSLDQAIRARVRQLPEPERHLLEIVAVAAQPIELSVARQAAQLRTEDYSLMDLLRAGHLVRTRTTPDRQEIETYHDRIREAITAHLPPLELQAHHRSLALALEASSRADPETLALHFQAAADLPRAGRYAMAAADHAAEALAFDRAARLYRLALELQPAQSGTAGDLQRRLGEVLGNAGRGAEAAEAYLAAAAAAGGRQRLEDERRAAEQLLISGHLDQGLVVIRNVLGAAGMRLAATPRRALLSLLLLRARIRLHGLRFRERDAAGVPPEELLQIDTCWTVARGLAIIDTMRAAEFHARHLLSALRAGEVTRVSRALAFEAGYHAIAGGRRRARTRKTLQAAAALAHHTADPYAMGLATLTAGTAAFLEGRWRETRELLLQAETTLRERCAGVAWELATARLMGCVALFFLGELDALSHRLPALLRDAQAHGNLYEATDLEIRISHAVSLAADDPPKAGQEVRRALARWPQREFYVQHWWGLIAETEIALYSGQSWAAWRLLEARWPALRRSFLLHAQYILIESLHHRAASALAVASGGELDAAERSRLLKRAAQDAGRIERERMPWANPLAQLIRAGIAASRERVEDATVILEAAEAGFVAADMSLYAAAARRRRGELMGGERGRTLMDDADDSMRLRSVQNPERMTAMLAAGCGGVSSLERQV